jgi:hypothetical protein
MLIYGSKPIQERVEEFDAKLIFWWAVAGPIISTMLYITFSPILALLANVWGSWVEALSKSTKIFILKKHSMSAEDVALLVDKLENERKNLEELATSSEQIKAKAAEYKINTEEKYKDMVRELSKLRDQNTELHNQLAKISAKMGDNIGDDESELEKNILIKLMHYYDEERANEVTSNELKNLIEESLNKKIKKTQFDIATNNLMKSNKIEINGQFISLTNGGKMLSLRYALLQSVNDGSRFSAPNVAELTRQPSQHRHS